MPSAELQLPVPKLGTAEGFASQPMKISICTLPLAQLYRDSGVQSQGYPWGQRGGKGNEAITPQQRCEILR